MKGRYFSVAAALGEAVRENSMLKRAIKDELGEEAYKQVTEGKVEEVVDGAKKRIRRDKRTVLKGKIKKAGEKVASIEKKLDDAKSELNALEQELELMDNEELRKQQEEEQKKIAELIRKKGLSLQQLEELLNK
jgi:TolA-binding protein